ncbi:hypothetical protein [Portibacter lacus]|uniref:Uncharacterized protein n=1 Tax=Portibacter lacus TaxID=1099794 RepID=A0AA37SQ39_9BACT|nr:hypothetical protein [Portibacter lacus]GLR18773.1 hypothetical protein GCM10007940_33890 [Portibacter lacus]
MSRINATLLFIFIFCAAINAQKLKDKAVVIKYVSLPSIAVPLDYKTFSVEAGGEVLQISGVSPKGFADDFSMQGFKKVNGYGGSAGHLHLVVDLGYLTIGKEEMKTKTTKTKDKSGNEVIVKEYYYAVPFSGSSSAKIIDPDGRILSSKSEVYDRELGTQLYKNQAQLKKSANKLINDITRDAAQEIRRNAYSYSNSMLQSFDFRKTSTREQIYLITKHSSEDQWEKHYETIKLLFSSGSHYPNTEFRKEKLEPAIRFYKQMASKDPRGDKKKKRIYKAANLNLSTIYYYLEDMASSIEYAELSLKAMGKDSRSSNRISKAERTLERMRDIGVSTIYYERDLSNALPPGAIANQEAENERLLEDANANNATIVYRNEEVYGKMLLDKEADDLIFGEGGNVKFVVNKDGVLDEIKLTDYWVSSFEVADRKFTKMKFSPSAKGKTEASVEILEEVYQSESLKLYKYYPSSGALSDEKPEFAFQKSGQEFPISLESTSFLLWEKGLSDYFSDCEDLRKIIQEGGIKKTKEDLIKAARVYSEICKKVIRP